MSTSRLGKISYATFGFGGYQDCQLGFWLSFQGEAWGVSTGKGFWPDKPTEHHKWTAQDQLDALGKEALMLAHTLKAAKKKNVQELVGVPVTVLFGDDDRIIDWRVLTEVL